MVRERARLTKLVITSTEDGLTVTGRKANERANQTTFPAGGRGRGRGEMEESFRFPAKGNLYLEKGNN